MKPKVDYEKLATYRDAPIDAKTIDERERELRRILSRFPTLVGADSDVVLEAVKKFVMPSSLPDVPEILINASRHAMKLLVLGDIRGAAELLVEAEKQAALESAQPYIQQDAEIGQRFRDQQSEGGKKKNDKYKAARDLCLEIADERWAEEREQRKPITRKRPMAESIKKVLAAGLSRLGLDKAPTVDTIAKWISPVAPPEASRPGRT